MPEAYTDGFALYILHIQGLDIVKKTGISKSMNVAEIITEKIVNEMQKTGIAPWHKPWNSLRYRNAVSKKAYRGINVMMLSMFGTDEWYMTPKQIFQHGGKIQKGTKAIPIVFWKHFDEKKDAVTGNVTQKQFFILRYYNVFGLNQTEDVKIKLPESAKLDFKPIEEAEKLIAASGVKIVFQGNSACYVPALHTVYMPAKSSFESIEAYYATLFHELTHWSRTEVDKNAKIDWTGFGSEPYSKEELVAEIGANFLLSHCGIDASKTFDNSISYLNNWAQRLGGEPRLIVNAANQAQKRFDMLLSRAYPTLKDDLADEENIDANGEDKKENNLVTEPATA